jgi:gluconokinase
MAQARKPRSTVRHAVLGVDVGTTAAKAVVFDAAGTELGAGEVRYPLLEPEPGQAVQDPEVVIQGASEAIRAAVSRAGGPVAGVAFSAAMHGLLAVGAGGRVLTPLVTWADSRATPQAARLRAERIELQAQTGTPLHPMSPLAKLRWFAEREPDTFEAAHRWVGLKELLLARWGGDWVIDHSLASGTGLLDLRALDWHEGALEAAGVRPGQLSLPVPGVHVMPLRPDVAAALGVDGATPLVVGGADGPLANLGLGAVTPGVAAVSIGTSGALRVVVPERGSDPRLFCYVLGPGQWVVGGGTSSGGVTLEWASRALAPDLGFEALLDVAAQAPPGSDGLMMVPALLGERSPSWDAAARGAYVGLSRAHGRAHLVRAALEGVCFQLAIVLDAVRDAGHEVREVRATGGFARSPLWRQMLADVLGIDIGFAAGGQASALGAALLAFRALGIDAEPAPIALARTAHPEPGAAAVYAAMRADFARASARA